jgi:transcriptional regulator with XRE-family HTH domain
VPKADLFFKRLGSRLQGIRLARGWKLDDMETVGFDAKHWSQIEGGRPITVKTMLRICESLDVTLDQLLTGLDKDIYDLQETLLSRQRRDLLKRKAKSAGQNSEGA